MKNVLYEETLKLMKENVAVKKQLKHENDLWISCVYTIIYVKSK